MLWGTSLVIQWLRLHVPNTGGTDSIPHQGTSSCMLQLRSGAATLIFLKKKKKQKTMLWYFWVDRKGPKPNIYMYPLSLKLPSHPGCNVTLSRVPMLSRALWGSWEWKYFCLPFLLGKIPAHRPSLSSLDLTEQLNWLKQEKQQGNHLRQS